MGCYCDFEQPKFFNKTMRKARSQHKCTECYRIIQPGERYEFVSGKWEDDIATFKTCSHCIDVRDYMEDNADCYCRILGEVQSDARDFIHNMRPWIPLARLVIECRHAGGKV